MGIATTEYKRISKRGRPARLEQVAPSRSIAESLCGFTTEYTLATAVDMLLADCRARKLSHNTTGMYRDGLSRLQTYLGRDKVIADISVEDLKAHIDAEAKRGLSAKTLKTRQQCIKRLFGFLLTEELIDKDPSQKLPDIRVPRKVSNPIPLDQIQRMLDYFDQSTPQGLRNKIIVLLLIDTGGRVSEIANIRTANIDIDRMRIKIVGKGNIEGFLNLSNSTRLLLLRYMRKIAPPGQPIPTYLFESHRGKPITRTAIAKMLREVGHELGIPNVHAHRFRDTFASEFAASSGDAFALQRELRHADIQMSMRYVEQHSSSIQPKHEEHSPVANLIVNRRK